MKAIVITRTGGPEVLEVAQAPDPAAKPGEAAVKIEAAGVNFADLLMISGRYAGGPAPPFVAGREFAGALDSGERVMGYAQMGGFAERIAISRDLIWPVPAGWSAAEAAAFPVNFFTAYFAYWEAGLIPRNHEGGPHVSPSGMERQGGQKRVLIHAAAGGVGTAAVQIGRALGLEMFGTSSSNEKLGRLRSLGLQHGINYAEQDYELVVKELTRGEGVDAVLEMLGGEHPSKSVRCLRWFGCVISYGSATGAAPQLEVRSLYARNTSVHGLWLSRLAENGQLMKEAWLRLSDWIARGKIRPVVGQVLPLERAADAFRLLKDRKNFGKVVLTV